MIGPYEGLFYIDNDYSHVYVNLDDPTEDPETRLLGDLSFDELQSEKWAFDEDGTICEQDDIEECFVDDFTRMFPAFERAGLNRWLGRCQRVILESKLFYICIEDNEWSVAVELIQKEEPNGFGWMMNLQKRLYQKYLDGMKECLLKRLPSIGTYTGAWTSGRIERGGNDAV